MNKDYQKNRDLLVKGLQSLDFDIITPKGAYYLFVDISKFGMDDKTFANFLVENQGVSSIPGTSFYSSENQSIGKKYIRFSYSQKEATIKEALRRIEQKMEQLNY